MHGTESPVRVRGVVECVTHARHVFLGQPLAAGVRRRSHVAVPSDDFERARVWLAASGDCRLCAVARGRRCGCARLAGVRRCRRGSVAAARCAGAVVCAASCSRLAQSGSYAAEAVCRRLFEIRSDGGGAASDGMGSAACRSRRSVCLVRAAAAAAASTTAADGARGSAAAAAAGASVRTAPARREGRRSPRRSPVDELGPGLCVRVDQLVAGADRAVVAEGGDVAAPDAAADLRAARPRVAPREALDAVSVCPERNVGAAAGAQVAPDLLLVQRRDAVGGDRDVLRDAEVCVSDFDDCAVPLGQPEEPVRLALGLQLRLLHAEERDLGAVGAQLEVEVDRQPAGVGAAGCEQPAHHLREWLPRAVRDVCPPRRAAVRPRGRVCVLRVALVARVRHQHALVRWRATRVQLLVLDLQLGDDAVERLLDDLVHRGEGDVLQGCQLLLRCARGGHLHREQLLQSRCRCRPVDVVVQLRLCVLVLAVFLCAREKLQLLSQPLVPSGWSALFASVSAVSSAGLGRGAAAVPAAAPGARADCDVCVAITGQRGV